MKPRQLLQLCGWCIARYFNRNVWHLNITRNEDRFVLVEFLVAFARHYYGILTPRGIEDQLYRSLMVCLRNRVNPPVFLTAMLVYCPKVTIDQIAMLSEHRQHSGVMGSGLYLSQDECWGMLQVLTEYQKQQSLLMNQGKEKVTENFMLPTTCLVLEGIYFHDANFLAHLLEKMPNLCHISLQHNGTQGVLRTLSQQCKHLKSLCFLEPSIEASIQEKDIFSVFFGISSTRLQCPGSILKKFTSDQDFRESCAFQFPNLRKLDIDELFFDEDIIHDIYTLTLLLQPKLKCFGKHTGLTKRILTNYKKIWSIMNNRPESEATVHLTEAKFVDSVSVITVNTSVELDYWKEVVPMFENLASVELQKSLWSEKEIAQFCSLFSSKVRAFSLGELPLSDMSCLSNMTHLRLTLSRHYSFDKMHLILDSCPNLKTLSIHPTFYHEESRRNRGGLDQLHLEQMMEEDLNIFERLMFAEVVVNVQPVLLDQERAMNHDNNVALFLGAEIPAPAGGEGALPNVRPAFMSRSASRKELVKHHNLTTLRIASLCEAEQKQSEDFLLGLFERLPNLRNLCLGVWMGSLSQRRQFLTCTANALVSVVTDKERKEPLLPHLRQLCCLPTGNEIQMCQSLASLVEALPSLQTLVLPVLDMYMLARTFKYFQHSSLDIQYKCATDQVFSYWGPEH